MKRYFLILSFLFHLTPALFGGNDPRPGSRLTEYQRNVIHYFNEIALGFEFGTASGITRKWKSDVKIFVDGNPSHQVRMELHRVVDELNELILDDIQIRIVDQKEQANLHAYVGTSAEFAKLYPIDKLQAQKNSGFYRIFWNKENTITRGYFFVNTGHTGEKEQRHVIREELTQTLGLGKDSRLYADSIFQSEYTTVTEYAEIDREIIRMLYHPAMKTGLSSDKAQLLLEELLTGNFVSAGNINQ